MSTSDIAKRTHVADLNEDRSVRVAPEGHSSLEEDVGTRLSGRSSLVGRVRSFDQVVPQSSEGDCCIFWGLTYHHPAEDHFSTTPQGVIDVEVSGR